MSDSLALAAGAQRLSEFASLVLLVLAHAPCQAGAAPATSPAGVASTSPATAPAQTRPASPEPEWTETERPRRFVGQDLFNHIDGAAELFLEMGFREVFVRLYSNERARLVHEVYEMKDATAARGMYLRFRGRGTPVVGVAGRNVGNRYQITAQKDRYFIQITNIFGEESSLPKMVRLANQTLEAIPNDEDVALLDLLPVQGLLPGSEVIVCGLYSLQSVFTLGEGDVLQLQGQKCGVAGDYVTEQEGSFTRLIVPYGRSAAAQAAFQHLLQRLDSELHVVRRNEHTVVFRATNGQFGSFTISNDKLDIRLHLARDPGAANQPAPP